MFLPTLYYSQFSVAFGLNYFPNDKKKLLNKSFNAPVFYYYCLYSYARTEISDFFTTFGSFDSHLMAVEIKSFIEISNATCFQRIFHYDCDFKFSKLNNAKLNIGMNMMMNM